MARDWSSLFTSAAIHPRAKGFPKGSAPLTSSGLCRLSAQGEFLRWLSKVLVAYSGCGMCPFSATFQRKKRVRFQPEK